MILLFAAFWLVLEQYELMSSESTQATPPSHHLFLLLLWFLPVSVALIAMVWFSRSRNHFRCRRRFDDYAVEPAGRDQCPETRPGR